MLVKQGLCSNLTCCSWQGSASPADLSTAQATVQDQQLMIAQLQQQNQTMSQQLAELEARSAAGAHSSSASRQQLADLKGQHDTALSSLSALQAQHSELGGQHAELQKQHALLLNEHTRRTADHDSATQSLSAVQTQNSALGAQSAELQRQHAEAISSFNALKGDHEALTRQQAGLQVFSPFHLLRSTLNNLGLLSNDGHCFVLGLCCPCALSARMRCFTPKRHECVAAQHVYTQACTRHNELCSSKNATASRCHLQAVHLPVLLQFSADTVTHA